MNAVLRGLRRVLIIGTATVVVIVGVLAQAGAYLFGFTTTTARPTESAYAGLDYSASGTHPVGVVRISPEEDDAPVRMTVWYPASATDEEPPMTYSYSLKVLGPRSTTALATYEGTAALDAAADRRGGPYPLVVLSSGFAISSGSYAWLAEHLASYGMVVVAPQHEETLDPGMLWRAAGARTDVIAQTRAYLGSASASGGVLAGLIDTHTVAVLGHSYGGYTALAAGGAGLDADAFATGCATARKDQDPIVFLCDALQPNFDQIIDATNRAPDNDLPPIRAVASLAGDAAMFGAPGMRSLSAPLLVMGGTADDDSPYNWSTRLAYQGAASTRKIEVALDGAEHFVFSGRCASVRRIVALVPMGFCDDPAWDRARARAVIRHYVTAFLLAELTDEPDARSALAPWLTAVAKVGYRAVGY
jgi:predicted dienelactone hydrolase